MNLPHATNNVEAAVGEPTFVTLSLRCPFHSALLAGAPAAAAVRSCSHAGGHADGAAVAVAQVHHGGQVRGTVGRAGHERALVHPLHLRHLLQVVRAVRGARQEDNQPLQRLHGVRSHGA